LKNIRIVNLIATLCLLIFPYENAFCQSLFNINGTVKSTTGEPVEAATVFLNGTSRVTKTNADGSFAFKGISSGSYDIVVTRIGYSSSKVNALVNSGNEQKTIELTPKNIQLNEVQIGKKSRGDKYLSIFFENFIGATKNAAFCTILNPQVIEFSTRGNTILAFSDEFIIINNKRLGFKISYLLRDFSYDRRTTTTVYDGECIFEELKGTESQQKIWRSNRLKAYKGSFMHYLRTLYAGTTVKEGFVTYANDPLQYRLIDSLVNVKTYVSKANTNFINLAFIPQLKVIYAGSYVAPGITVEAINPFNLKSLPTSYLSLVVSKAVVDKKGSYEDYKSFFIEGLWGNFRLGDRLPYEYEPRK